MLGDDLPETERKEIVAGLKRLAPQLALLRVETAPPGATVYVDRKDLGGRGQTPLTLALPAGKVSAMIELEGHRPATSVAKLVVGGLSLVKLELERIYGRLDVDGSPGNYELRLDRSDEGPYRGRGWRRKGPPRRA